MKHDYSNLKPRLDKVLLRVEKVAERDGLAVPQMSALSNKWTVVAFGSEVDDLSVGDEVLVSGNQNESWAYLPGYQDLIIIDQANVLVVVNPTTKDAYEEALNDKVSDR